MVNLKDSPENHLEFFEYFILNINEVYYDKLFEFLSYIVKDLTKETLVD